MCLDTFYYEETSEAMPNHLWRRGNYATTDSCSAIRKLWKKIEKKNIIKEKKKKKWSLHNQKAQTQS